LFSTLCGRCHHRFVDIVYKLCAYKRYKQQYKQQYTRSKAIVGSRGRSEDKPLRMHCNTFQQNFIFALLNTTHHTTHTTHNTQPVVQLVVVMRPSTSDDKQTTTPTDAWRAVVERTGCAVQNDALEACMTTHRDWRQCQQELTVFRACVEKAQIQQQSTPSATSSQSSSSSSSS
jgi:hypothetical protein